MEVRLQKLLLLLIKRKILQKKTNWTITIGGTGDAALEAGTTKATLTISNNGTSSTYYVYIIKADDSETRLKTLTIGGSQVSNFDRDDNHLSNENAYTADHSTDSFVVAGAMLSNDATVSVTKKCSPKTLDKNATDWGTINEEGVTTGTGSFSFTEFPPSSYKSILYIVTVSSASTTDSATRTYQLLVNLQRSTDATLKTLKATQSGTDSNSYTILEESPSKTEYSGNASLNYTGDIVVKAEKNDSKATLGEPTINVDNLDISDKVTINSETKQITIPYNVYSTYAGKSIVITYTVTAEDKTTTKTYTLTINIPQLEEATMNNDKAEIASESAEYYYSINNTHRMGYRFGSQRSDGTDTDFADKFGGIDIVGTTGESSDWIVSSFKCSGWIYCLNIDGTDYWVTLGDNGSSTALTTLGGTTYDDSGVSLTVTPTIQYEGTGADAIPYLTLKHEVTTGVHTVKLGAIIDTLVGTYENNGNPLADQATITPTNYGIDMSNSDYKFSVILKDSVGVDNVDNLWYGEYGNEVNCIWNDTAVTKTASGVDTAVSYSWKGASSDFTKTIRMSLIAN